MSLLWKRIFQGLRSRWKYPFLCRQASPVAILKKMALIQCSVRVRLLSSARVYTWYRLHSRQSKTRNSSELARMTSLNLTILVCSSFFKHFIYLSTLQSSQVLYLLFIFFMATIQLLGSMALKTTPQEPSPMAFTILYFYITINYNFETSHPLNYCERYILGDDE